MGMEYRLNDINDRRTVGKVKPQSQDVIRAHNDSLKLSGMDKLGYHELVKRNELAEIWFSGKLGWEVTNKTAKNRVAKMRDMLEKADTLTFGFLSVIGSGACSTISEELRRIESVNGLKLRNRQEAVAASHNAATTYSAYQNGNFIRDEELEALIQHVSDLAEYMYIFMRVFGTALTAWARVLESDLKDIRGRRMAHRIYLDPKMEATRVAHPSEEKRG